MIERAIERPLHDHIGYRCRALGCTALATGGVEDHVHVLVRVHPAVAVADLVRDLKACSSGMLRRVFGRSEFAWQAGYGAITLRRCEIETVREYIHRQREHHARRATHRAWEPLDSVRDSAQTIADDPAVSRGDATTILAELAAELSSDARLSLAEALLQGTPSATLHNSVPPSLRASLGVLIACIDRGDLDRRAAATALRVAATVFARAEAAHRSELTWTGPSPLGSTLRRIDQCLLDLLRTAERRITVATFVAGHVPNVTAALIAALGRGARVRALLDTPEDSEGRISAAPSDTLRDVVAAGAVLLEWPLARRPRDERGHVASMHAKFAVVDDAVLIASANLTGSALARNLEIGVVLHDAALAARLEDHLDALLARGEIVPRVR